jgi:hypothetical protein
MAIAKFLDRTPAPIFCTALLIFGIACSGGDDEDSQSADAGPLGPDASQVDESEALFQPDHILEVNITLAAADWETLRNQPDVIGMPKTTCGNQPLDKPYDYYQGEITVDGTTVGNVGVRKKGGFGSITNIRPGLRIKAHEYTPGQRISGLKRLTLNNNHQDSTLISQCLGYSLFRSAGLPAPRCSFAHVTVNGEDLGIYSNVESIKKDFLRRHFSDDSGNLYESGGDFKPGGASGFQPKVNKDAPDCSDLDPVVTAMESSDAELYANLGAVVNMDKFMTYWSMEVLTDHWDGYANNRNNYFFYHDPASDQLEFIPWGIDALFSGRARTTRPASVFACGSMAWRLYNVPQTRAMYIAKLREVISSVWDESAILAEITRMETLLSPIADPQSTGEYSGRLQSVRDFVSTRSDVLLAELDAGTPVWPYAEDASCLIDIGTMSATFDTTWDTLENYAIGSGTTSGTVGGVSIDSTTVPTGVGLDEEGKVVIRLLGDLGGGIYAVAYIIYQDAVNFVPGTMDLDLVNVAAIMSFYDANTDTSYGGGLMLGGSVTLVSASMGVDAAVTGSFTGTVREF